MWGSIAPREKHNTTQEKHTQKKRLVKMMIEMKKLSAQHGKMKRNQGKKE